MGTSAGTRKRDSRSDVNSTNLRRVSSVCHIPHRKRRHIRSGRPYAGSRIRELRKLQGEARNGVGNGEWGKNGEWGVGSGEWGQSLKSETLRLPDFPAGCWLLNYSSTFDFCHSCPDPPLSTPYSPLPTPHSPLPILPPFPYASSIGARTPCSRASSIAFSYPASTWRMMPIPGSVVSTRCNRRDAS